jgi:glutamyl-tRNA synthetase
MFRIAPTPSGYLHLGNAFSFLLARRLADKNGDKLLLRIDDLDSERIRQEYVDDIFESLDWLGIRWETGPKDADDFRRHWSQHIRMEEYRKVIAGLISEKKVFACRCTRKTIPSSGTYPGTCENLDIPYDTVDTALRIRVPSSAEILFNDACSGTERIALGNCLGSFIIRRRDGVPAYQLASLVDDRLFGVTYVVRGRDLLESTAAQLFLAGALGYDHFCTNRFLHHELLPDENGMKLSKSEGSYSLKSMRTEGVTAAEIRNILRSQLERYSNC